MSRGRGGDPEHARRTVGACMFRASLPAADASNTSLRAGVEDNLAHRLRATAMEGGRAHDAIHRGFQSNRVGRDLDPDYPVGIRLPALPEEPGGALELGTVSIAHSSRDARIAAALYFVKEQGVAINRSRSAAGQ